MKKAWKVIIKVTCECVAVVLLLYEAYDMIRAKIKKIEHETWNEAWDKAYKSGYNTGRFDGLIKAAQNKYITYEEYEELIEED